MPTPTPTVGIRARPFLQEPRGSRFSCQASAPEPYQSQPVSTATRRATPTPPRPLAQGTIPSRAWVHLLTSRGSHPRANTSHLGADNTRILVFGSVCTYDAFVCPAAGSREAEMVYVVCPP